MCDGVRVRARERHVTGDARFVARDERVCYKGCEKAFQREKEVVLERERGCLRERKGCVD